MSVATVLLPLFVQVALTIGLFMWMAYYRVTILMVMWLIFMVRITSSSP